MPAGQNISDVTVANMALSAIKAPKINSMTEQTPQGNAVSLWYYVDRDAYVQETRWTWARKSALLTAVTVPDNRWAYSYLYPGDCLNIDELCYPELLNANSNSPSQAGIYPDQYTGGYRHRKVSHEIGQIEVNGQPTGQQVIFCNIDAAVLIYTRQITNPNIWPVTFLRAFVFMLALDLAGELVTAPEIVTEVKAKFARADPYAKRVSVNEVTDNDHNMSRIERAHRGGGNLHGGSPSYL